MGRLTLFGYMRLLRRWGLYSLCLLFVLGGILLVWAWPNLGTLPSASHQERISKSPHYDTTRNRFVNRRQPEYDEMLAQFDFLSLISAQISGEEVGAPAAPMPYGEPSIEDFLSRNEMSYIWLGHSSILMRLEHTTILFDPIFGNAAPLPFLVPRFQDPVLPLDQLPDIDVIVISHDHYDHLDKRTIDYFVERETVFLVPLGVSSYLMGWGIPKNRIIELDWWEEVEHAGLSFACTPSQHFSGRLGPRGNKTLWASWVVVGGQQRAYFSGDSGYDTHFKEIGAKYGPFDVAFMESGQYNPMWHMSHMFPEEAVQGAIELKAMRVHPIHWGMFRLSTHDWFDPPKRVQNAAPSGLPILFPKIGSEVVVSTYEAPKVPWWTALLPNPK